MQRQFNCVVNNDLSLSVVNDFQPNGVVAVLSVTDDSVSGRTATLTWAGMVQAFLHYDVSGQRVIAITPTGSDPAVMRSIENIVLWL